MINILIMKLLYVGEHYIKRFIQLDNGDLFNQKGEGKFRIIDMSEYNLYDVPIVEGKGDIIKKLNGNKIWIKNYRVIEIWSF